MSWCHEKMNDTNGVIARQRKEFHSVVVQNMRQNHTPIECIRLRVREYRNLTLQLFLGLHVL
jgi:hypothetical protein